MSANAVINVGAATEVELKEKKHRAENAGVDGANIVDKAKSEKKGIGFDAAKITW